MKSPGARLGKKRAAGAVSLLAALSLLAACGGGDGDGGGASAADSQTDSGGAITVWVDPPRVPAAEAFEKAHPDIDITINQIDGTVGGKSLQQQFAQFNQAGKGWPDAIFFPSNDDIAWASGAQIDYAADLTELLPDVIEGYDEAVIAPCAIDGEIRCLRNDAAPDVFWYNAKFFEQNGYEVPTTWEEYGDLAVQIAEEHPGKISGFTGDAYAPDRYLWASGCPTNARQSETEVVIDLDDPTCVRAKDLLTTMVEADAASPLGIFDADAASVGKDLVMSPGAAWWGDYLFRTTWKIPAGEMTAVEPLAWEGEDSPSTGNEGGGLWGVSSHIKGKQLENTLEFARFVATDPAWQVELSTGLPAYGPVQDAWAEKQAEAKYFADNDTTFEAMKAAISHVKPDHAYMLYNTGSVWTETIAPALVDGQPLDAAWSDFGTELLNQAKAMGYTVK
ncbi:ABC transporter substrate-binding protein [Nocardioides sp. Arc9.136]|uniref:ABC transporter substrate-binding protein n=1 Tax=Nocardioides sp. Arc9.136 TaxID=2996826 RepID=UPI0026658D85|nr:extracellular solute-binding protein [Nocardioides sp. Arc9.136]WKN48749.1 extracellular solute-binding protein [Nocardioides sp. Arc9.136]